MTVELDALAVVNQLRDLAADPMNRRAIVQDQGCLPGLILFLDHTNPQVVYSALLVSCSLIQVFFWLGVFSSYDRLSFEGDSVPGGMSSEPGEAEGGAGNDAEPSERHSEVSVSLGQELTGTIPLT